MKLISFYKGSEHFTLPSLIFIHGERMCGSVYCYTTNESEIRLYINDQETSMDHNIREQMCGIRLEEIFLR